MNWQKPCLAVALLLVMASEGAALAHEAHHDHEAEAERAVQEAGAAAVAHRGAQGSDAEPASLFLWPGRLHPMLVHFPVALFAAAALAELLFARTGHDPFHHVVRFCVWLAALGAALAVPTGWLFARAGASEPGWILETHRWTGVGSLTLSVVVVWLVERAERGAGRTALRVALVVQLALVAVTGFLGGSLLYGIDHLWRHT